jgi:hypothetical protein
VNPSTESAQVADTWISSLKRRLTWRTKAISCSISFILASGINGVALLAKGRTLNLTGGNKRWGHPECIGVGAMAFFLSVNELVERQDQWQLLCRCPKIPLL